MIVSRKGFNFDPVPSDRQVWAIGMVAVHWSAVEMMVSTYVHAITTPGDAECRLFEETRNTKLRLDQFYALVDHRMMEPNRASLLRLINRIREMQAERDKIVHGGWSDTGWITEPPAEPNPEAVHAFALKGMRRPFEWRLDFGKIIGVARKIDEVHTLMWGLITTMKPDGGLDFTARSALQRTLHKQYQSE